jgi:MarR family transcriptional regulator, transcriptional regulator for hemolysin
MSRRTKDFARGYKKMKRIERNRIGFLIHDVSRLRRTAFDHLVKPLDVTRSQWWVLNGLSSHGNHGITQTALARALDLGKVALGGIVERLENRGLVKRRPDADDRRTNRVFLTRKGNQMLERAAKIGTTMDTKVMRGISIARQNLLGDILHAMKTNLVALDAVPGSKVQTRE